MSVINDDSLGSDENITNILSELKLIDEQHRKREKIYQQCLNQYLSHLNLETKQLERSEPEVQKRNKNIIESFETVYDTIYDGADRALRNIRRTYETKRDFWAETIEEFVNIDDLQIKKDIYNLKRDAQDKYEDSIDARKNMKKIPFKRVFTKKQADKTLLNFQESNNVFEEKVYLGTQTSAKWRPLQNTYFGSANKQNEIHNKPSFRSTQRKQGFKQEQSVLNFFIRK